MTIRRWSAVLWIVAGAGSAAATFLLRVVPPQSPIAWVASGLAVSGGVALGMTPKRSHLRIAGVAGAIWAALYFGLALVQTSNLPAWGSDVGLALLGAAAAIVLGPDG